MEYINLEIINKCKICDRSLEEIKHLIGKKRAKYNIWYFLEHIKLHHSISILDYLVVYEKLVIPKCICGICNKNSYPTTKGKNLYWREYLCGRNPGLLKWSIQAKESRKGSNNPMFGKKAWNKNIDKNSDYVKNLAKYMANRTVSEASKEKMSISATKRKVHGHTGCKHTDKTKAKSRERTLQMIKDGKFKQTKTIPHKKFAELLTNNNIKFEEEKIIDKWSFDFFLPDSNTYVEIDGDYFHSNPIIYKNGPKTKTQKINWYRDIKKNEFCQENNINLVRFWENEVLNNSERIEQFICKQKVL